MAEWLKTIIGATIVAVALTALMYGCVDSAIKENDAIRTAHLQMLEESK